jgi:hypothetical protein
MITLIAKLMFMLYFGVAAMWMDTQQEGTCDNWNATMTIHGLDSETFSPIMWRESRCEAWQVNEDDPNGGSYGLLQINAIHLEDVQLHPDKWAGVERCQVTTTGDLLIGWRNICFATHLVERAGTDPWGL